MKTFASASFFRIFDRHVRPADLLNSGPSWSVEGVNWTQTRQFFGGADFGYSTDVFIGVRSDERPWRIMVVNEAWWIGGERQPFRTGRWARFVKGDRAAALAWFKALEVRPGR